MKLRKIKKTGIIQCLLAATLGLSACTDAPQSQDGASDGTGTSTPTPTGSEGAPSPLKSVPAAPTVPDSEVAAKIFAQWAKLIEGSSPDLALAQMLAGTVSAIAPDEASRLMKEFDNWSLSDTDLSDKIEAFKQSLSNSYLQNRLKLSLSDRSVDNSIVKGSIFASSDKNLFANDRMSAIVDLSIKSYLNNKSYQLLMGTYSEALKEAAQAVANDVTNSLEPSELDKILAAIKNALLGHDQIVDAAKKVISKNQKLSLSIQHVSEKAGVKDVESIVLEQVSNEVVNSLMGSAPSFSIPQTLDQLEQRVGEIFVFKTSLDQEAKKVRSDLNDLGNKSQALLDSLKKKKDFLKDVTGKIIGGKSPDADEMSMAESLSINPAFGSSEGGEFQEWSDFISSAQSSVDRIDNVCGTAMNIAHQLGIHVDPNIQKIVKTVSQVNQALQIGVSVAAAFATGGATAILSAFGGVGGLMGSSGPDMSGIENELSEIREQQQVIIQNEMKIMEMMKDLADMIGQFHEEEMAQLYIIDQDIKDTAGIMTMMNWANCKKMMAALPQGVAQDAGQSTLSWNQGFQTYGRFVDADGIQKFISDTAPYYSQCTSTLGATLSPMIDNEVGSDMKTSILRYTVSGDDQNSQFLERSVYHPLLDYTLQNKRGNGIDIPAAKMEVLASKYHAFSVPEAERKSDLQLNYLLSSKRLQVYVMSYLNLRPFVQIDASLWSSTFASNDSPEQKMKSFFGSTELTYAHSRSVNDLKAILDLIQSAVAQESILAGEPILDLLSEQFADIFSEQESPLNTAIRADNILLSNVLNYAISQSVPPENWADYEQARVSGDVNHLVSLFGQRIGEPLRANLVVDAHTQVVRVHVPAANSGAQGLQVELPTLLQLRAGQLVYRSTMGQLVELQSRVMDELKDLSASPLKPEDLKKMSAILLIQSKTQINHAQ